MVNESYFGKEQPYNVFNELSHADLEQQDRYQSQSNTGGDEEEDFRDIIPNNIFIHPRSLGPTKKFVQDPKRKPQVDK